MNCVGMSTCKKGGQPLFVVCVDVGVVYFLCEYCSRDGIEGLTDVYCGK